MSYNQSQVLPPIDYPCVDFDDTLCVFVDARIPAAVGNLQHSDSAWRDYCEPMPNQACTSLLDGKSFWPRGKCLGKEPLQSCSHMHTYIHTCIHTYIHACIHTYIHTYIHTRC
jgi:hypothetical protein